MAPIVVPCWTARRALAWNKRSCVLLWLVDSPWTMLASKRSLSTFAHSAQHNHDLQRPTILFESNHLLVVNKPVGWHSVPNQGQPSNDPKCLLQYLVQQQLGGGSQRSFLKPLHRIDQPCSGVLLLGKTSRAASRIQTAWKHVQKTYLVVVPVPHQQQQAHLQSSNEDEWKTLSGYMLRRNSPHSGTTSSLSSWNHKATKKSGGWSVNMIPASPNNNSNNSSALNMEQYRYCTLDWRCLSVFSLPQQQQQYALLEIQTKQGARHMVRALLASHGLAVAGDLRYAGATTTTTTNLPDRSVALHAAVLELPATIPLGGGGATDAGAVRQHERRFVAPIPDTWATYFGISPSYVMEHLFRDDNRHSKTQ